MKNESRLLDWLMILLAAALVMMALALLASDDAEARTPTEADILAYQELANSLSPNPRCENKILMRRVRFIPKAPDDNSPGTVQGRAYPGECMYEILDDLDAYEMCVVMVHETRHVAMYRSSDPYVGPDGEVDVWHDKHGIMHPYASDEMAGGKFTPCVKAMEPVLTRDAAFEWIEKRWKSMATLDCRRQLRSRQRCWGRTVNGRRLHFVVWMDGDHKIKGGRLGRQKGKR